METTLNERNRAKDKFRTATSFVEYENQRIQFLIDYFTGLRNNYSTFLKRAPVFNRATFDRFEDKNDPKHTIVGYPGNQMTYAATSQQIAMKVINECPVFIDFITKQIIEPLANLLNLRLKYLNEKITEVKAASKEFKTIAAQYLENKKLLDETIGKIESTKYEMSNPNAKNLSKLKSEFPKLCNQFIAISRRIDIYAVALNVKLTKYMACAEKNAIYLISREPERLSTVTKTIVQIFPIFKSTSYDYTTPRQFYTSKPKLWDEDFIQFCRTNMIYHTNITSLSYQPPKLEFNDASFQNPIFNVSRTFVTPLTVATVVKDFNGKDSNQISAKEGDKIYLYDTTHQPWCLASKELDDKKGYIPSQYVQAETRKMAIIKGVQFADNEEMLSVKPKDIVVIIERKGEHYYLCENIEGKQGLVFTYLLIL